MPTIVKKGTNSSVFKLRNGKKIILAVSPVLNIISDDDFSALMKEYGNFINERRIDDKNPGGCFIIHDEKADATAHLLYLSMNPDKAASANLSSASEGSVSASFQLYSDPWRRYLSLSPYGTELLALLSTVQPPLPEKPVNVLPYYNSVGFR